MNIEMVENLLGEIVEDGATGVRDFFQTPVIIFAVGLAAALYVSENINGGLHPPLTPCFARFSKALTRLTAMQYSYSTNASQPC